MGIGNETASEKGSANESVNVSGREIETETEPANEPGTERRRGIETETVTETGGGVTGKGTVAETPMGRAGGRGRERTGPKAPAAGRGGAQRGPIAAERGGKKCGSETEIDTGTERGRRGEMGGPLFRHPSKT